MGNMDFSNYRVSGEDLILHVECDLAWTAFTAGTGGTFQGIWWQGSNYRDSDNTWAWAGSNYITAGLMNQFTLKNATTPTTAGAYHYDTIITIPGSWLATYSKSNIGFRCDYSDGTGKITVTNFKATPIKYYNARIGQDFISANNFIEK
jgi:hypothetical protein